MGLPYQQVTNDLLKKEGSDVRLNPILIHAHWFLDKTFWTQVNSNVSRILTPHVWNSFRKRLSTAAENTTKRAAAERGLKKYSGCKQYVRHNVTTCPV